ncbi:calmodulin-like protein 8 [Actinia tenebrosa]|uniref:Calmodulin-like protein 8 n=1 Tax=Actinia tenebrosa TaxID=6105 RepID=A0A6P8HR12_ACTTE|nr:calmodulin-like protein 8 [Actinia tenebrosa]
MKPVDENDEEFLLKAFTEADRDNDGMIGVKTLTRTIRNLRENVEEGKVAALLKRSGIEVNKQSNDEPEINFGIFLKLYRQLSNVNDQDAELKRAFEEFDIYKRGYIEGSGIERVLTKLNIEYAKEEIELMIEVADTNGDGKVDWDEFLQIFKNGEDIEG